MLVERVGGQMHEAARFIESFITVLAVEAENNGLTEVARLLKIASREAAEQARLLACDSAADDDEDGKAVPAARMH
jgi:hypothetical protein